MEVKSGWVYEPLDGKVRIEHGFGFQSQYFTSLSLYKLTTPGHFHEEGGFRNLGEKQKYYDGPFPTSFIFSKGDLMVAMTEQAEGLLGSAAIIPESGTYLHNQRLGKVKSLSPEIDVIFLYYIFNSPYFRSEVQETAVGTKVRHTSPKKLLAIPVLVPPITEQRAIAAALSDVDVLLTGLDALIAKKRLIKQGAMQELLTGKRRLPGFKKHQSYKHTETGIFPEDWKISTIQELAGNASNIIDGPFGSNLKNSDYIAHGIPVLQGQNISKDKFVWKDVRYVSEQKAKDLFRSNVRVGDILTVKIGSVGFSAIIDDLNGNEFAIIPANLLRTRILNQNVDSTFINYLLTSSFGKKKLQDLAGNTAQPAIGLSSFRKLTFSVPVLRKEQEAIAEILSDMDAEVSALEQRREKTRLLKQGMMQELLTGRIRLDRDL